jgi:Mrp family chromosome partitioning ATPase
VRALVDSLDDVEREREAFGVVSGVDPIYVQLTNRVTQLGRAIEAIAERRQSALRDELSAAAATPAPPATPRPADDTTDTPGAAPPVTPFPAVAPTADVAAPPRPPAPIIVDTTAEAAARDSARARVAADSARLAAARAQNVEIDRRIAEAHDRANLEAPPEAMLVAALALSVVAGFATALTREVRRPRVADGREAERVTRTRVLAVVRPDPAPPDRARRRADEEVPDLIDPSAASYRLLYLSLSATGAAVPVVTIVGDDPAIAATIVTNLATIGAEDGRSTLVIDADMGRAAASVALGLGFRIGLAEFARRAVPLGDALRSVSVGRGIALDVLPAGAAGPPTAPDVLDALREDLARLAARYDFTVISAPPTQLEPGGQQVLVAPDVIVCARAGHTPLTRLAREIARLREDGATVRGIVLWDDDAPHVQTLTELRAGGKAA